MPAVLETFFVGDPSRLLHPQAGLLWPILGLVVVGTVVPVICASDAVIVAAVGLPVLAEVC